MAASFSSTLAAQGEKMGEIRQSLPETNRTSQAEQKKHFLNRNKFKNINIIKDILRDNIKMRKMICQDLRYLFSEFLEIFKIDLLPKN